MSGRIRRPGSDPAGGCAHMPEEFASRVPTSVSGIIGVVVEATARHPS
jgi:hypothetical protein